MDRFWCCLCNVPVHEVSGDGLIPPCTLKYMVLSEVGEGARYVVPASLV